MTLGLGSSAFGGWAGLEVIGSPQTLKYPLFTGGVLEHEFGHNMGLSHQLASKKCGRITNDTKYGSMVNHDWVVLEQCTPQVKVHDINQTVKDHFGWLNDDKNIIDISFEYDFDNIPNDYIFTINAHDRPDIIHNDEDTISTGSNVCLIQIKYGSEFDYVGDVKMSVVYVYCRTSYVDGDNINSQGVGVQYCLYDNYYNWYESSASILTYTMDVRGDIYEQTDHYIPMNGSYVIQPFFASVESGQTTNHYHTKHNLLKVDVLETSNDWNKYYALNKFICNINPIGDREGLTSYNTDYDYDNGTHEPIVDDVYYCHSNEGSLSASATGNSVQTKQITLDSRSDIYVAHAKDLNNVTRKYRGTNLEFSVCGDDANIQTFVHDQHPWTIVNNDVNNMDQLRIRSLMTFSFLGVIIRDHELVRIIHVKCKPYKRHKMNIDGFTLLKFKFVLKLMACCLFFVFFHGEVSAAFFFSHVFSFSHKTKNRH